jgi:hypothetical protein
VKIKTASKYVLIFTVVFSLVTLDSCKKKTEDSETQSVVDNSICEQEFMQIQPTANSRAINTKGTGATLKTMGTTSLSPCDTLHKIYGDTAWTDPNHVNPIFEYDFSNCPNINGDNIARSGKYIVRLTGPIKTPGSKMIIKLSNYKVTRPGGLVITYSCDSMVVETLSSSFVSTAAGSLPSSFGFKIDVVNGKCTGSTGWTILYSSSKTIVTTTQGTAGPEDDVTVVNGTSSGTNRDNRKFDVTMYSLEKRGDCKWISKGQVDVSPEGFSTRSVDFGNGTCDDDATYTVNGQKIAFKLN